MIRELETQGVVSKTHSPFNSPIWPVHKSDGEWRLTVDYRALNEVTPPLSGAVPDMLELQYELESKTAKWPRFAFTRRGVQYTWNRLPQGWKHSPTICHGLIQAALEKGEAPEHLQCIDDIIVWGNTAMEVFEKGEKIIQILLKAGFAIKKSKVKGPAREIQFLGVKWHDGRRQIPTEVINKITAMSPPTSKMEAQAFLGAIGFWRMHIPEYSQIDGTRGEERALLSSWDNGLSWNLWQKVPGETRGRPLGFWIRRYRGSETNYTPTEKEILAAYEGVQAASEVVGTETQLLLAPQLPVLGWMFKAEVPSTHHATNATWSKWIALITQRARTGNPNRPGILEIITNWPEGENVGLMDEEEQEQVTRAEEGPPYNQLPAEETRYGLFTDSSWRIVGMKRKWKAAVWSPTRQVAQATEGEGGSSQLAELKAVQLALDIAEREKWPKLYLYTDSWMVANALWGWLEKWKKASWQRRGKPIWAADEWKDIATRVEKLPVKVRHVDAHVPKSRANEEHRNNEQVDQAAKIEVSKIDLDWQHKGELFLARWAHDASGHQGRDATYKWARDRGVDLTMDSISQVIHDCETCAAIKQAKRVKPLWSSGGSGYSLWFKASSSFGRTATEVGVSPPTPKPQDPPLPSSDSEWDEPEPLPPGPKIPSQGPIASRTQKQTRVVVQAPLRQAITSDGETKLIKVPFSSIDLEIWERIAKGYRSDPIEVAKKMKFMVKQHSPDWADLQLLLDALTETEKQLVLKVAGDLAEDDCRTTQEDVKDVFPLQDPGWDPNDDEELGRLKRYQELIVKGLERAIPKP
ncbi:hypothetical protein DUI87_13511 [Hirundo rustica rustica]|uniref:RNase H type-1 domain-containing protein n=1 Tax=Hirundo rustica rustica TaxID=333673 RepID=A0A3M0KES9_HIRRU|nr:hypothetical protein DUI87_13511 [Hirundo rustica rustica]